MDCRPGARRDAEERGTEEQVTEEQWNPGVPGARINYAPGSAGSIQGMHGDCGYASAGKPAFATLPGLVAPVAAPSATPAAMRHRPIQPVPGWRFRARRPDAPTLDWLLDPGSLTARLVALAGGDFRVRVTRLAWGLPTRDEADALGLRPGEWALVREVTLVGGGADWVVARSIIPRATLGGRNRQLARLGTRPLGAFLFRDPTLRRRAVQIITLPDSAPRATGHSTSASTHTVWGRRSTFILRGKPLLVAEYFLPALLTAPHGRA